MYTPSIHLVAVVGAGPAGLFAAKKIAEAGHRVVLVNRDLKPGGLAEYGIFPNKLVMKEGLRKQFRKILDLPALSYLGGVRVATDGAIRLEELRALGFSAVLVAAGAQGTKSLGLPGEDAEGVFHAKDLVYHYNHLPPFSERPFPIGRRCAVVGIGNVMVDVANYLVHFRKVEEVVAVARRGPAERAYDRKEFKVVAANLDREALRAEIDRIRDRLLAVGQDPDALFGAVAQDTPPAAPPTGATRVRFRFLASPKRVLADETGRVSGLEVEETMLVPKGDTTSAKGMGRTEVLPVDTVVFAIGDRVDARLGLPAQGGAFVTNPNPRGGTPDPANYEVFDPETGEVVRGVFLTGWSRKASDGLVGKARQDGELGAKVVLDFLAGEKGLDAESAATRVAEIVEELRRRVPDAVCREDVALLEGAESEEARRRGVPEFKFDRNEDMLAAIAARRAPATAS